MPNKVDDIRQRMKDVDAVIEGLAAECALHISQPADREEAEISAELWRAALHEPRAKREVVKALLMGLGREMDRRGI